MTMSKILSSNAKHFRPFRAHHFSPPTTPPRTPCCPPSSPSAFGQKKRAASQNRRATRSNLPTDLRKQPDLHKQRSKHQRNRCQQLDQNMEARSSRVLERIADRVPHDRGLMRLGLLAAILSRLDELLGI